MLKTFLSAGCMLACLAASEAGATEAGAGAITDIQVERSGVVVFSHTGERTGAAPACHQPGYGWTINAATPAGQAQLATLLTIKAQGGYVRIAGLGTCSDRSDTESVNVLIIADQPPSTSSD
jgi:hypothetical protein